MSARVLLVDDAQVVRLMLKRIFTEAGYEIAGEAVSGAQAVERYRELMPDLVMMDITMPEMKGIEAVKEIITLDPNAKIIMCSSIGSKAKVIEAVEAGAKNYILKPFEAQKVLDVVAAVLNGWLLF